jgi:protein-disulfide isomerase
VRQTPTGLAVTAGATRKRDPDAITSCVADVLRRSSITPIGGVGRLRISEVLPPEAPEAELYAELPLADPPGWGPIPAPVQLVAFIDYACPFSKKLVAELDAVRSSYPTTLRVLIRHAPDTPFARAALAAEAMGRFEPMFDQLFGQEHLDPADLPALARAAGLDPAELGRRMSSADVDERLADDQALADTFDLSGTPAMLINGERIIGLRSAELIAEEVEVAARTAAARATAR